MEIYALLTFRISCFEAQSQFKCSASTCFNLQTSEHPSRVSSAKNNYNFPYFSLLVLFSIFLYAVLYSIDSRTSQIPCKKCQFTTIRLSQYEYCLQYIHFLYPFHAMLWHWKEVSVNAGSEMRGTWEMELNQIILNSIKFVTNTITHNQTTKWSFCSRHSVSAILLPT